jgi:predicted transcriptional regulator
MCPLSERILEILQTEGASSPEFISNTLQMNASRRRVREQCRMLADAELLEPMTDDWEMFELTEEGMRYLDGDLDARHQPTPNPRNRLRS